MFHFIQHFIHVLHKLNCVWAFSFVCPCFAQLNCVWAFSFVCCALLGLSKTMIFFSKSLILLWFKSSHWKFFIAFITSLAHWVQTALLEYIKRRKIRHSNDTLIFDIVMHISIFWISTFFNWKICTWNHKVLGRSENPQG